MLICKECYLMFKKTFKTLLLLITTLLINSSILYAYGNPFVDGFKHSDCHIQGDAGFFWINMVKGYEYDVVLKNLYSKDRHIYIHEVLPNGTTSTKRRPFQQIGKPGHYTYIPTVSGKHYIEISGEGEPEIAYFYFAVEPVGTIDTTLYPEY